MNEQRRVCAELFNKDKNCCYAKIVEEKGEYPVITFQAKVKDGKLDINTIHNMKSRIDNHCYCVYCTHPSLNEERLVGSVEPYFAFYAPTNCPILQACETSQEKITLFKRVKNLFMR